MVTIICSAAQSFTSTRHISRFFSRLVIKQTNRHSMAYIEHHSGSVILSASTKEWAVKKFLTSNLDLKAMESIGKVLAQRCLECGLLEVHSGYEIESSSSKVKDDCCVCLWIIETFNFIIRCKYFWNLSKRPGYRWANPSVSSRTDTGAGRSRKNRGKVSRRNIIPCHR